MALDAAFLEWVIELRRPWLDEVMILASALGAGGFIWIAFGSIAGIFPKHTAAMWRLWLAVALSFLIVDQVMKPLVARARPFEVLPGIQLISGRSTTASFPSGHAAMAIAGALSGVRLLPAARWVLWPLAAIIVVSRVYLGVHWPTDVAAGAALGWALAWLVLGGRTRPRR